ncbi:acyltransferase family protein [Thalassotalea agarivorans]|uniref:Fucose 4-O-acetylase n=1 Tax=Thalassotalea agarivorans TaxID=349064 RepID=A0A1I0I008_THASX|nr:acyltransferase family protein [Thalassotalea agarivorans]SET89831.1 Fucose 4-O-acetylase [Thalassotalea agarivorans]
MASRVQHVDIAKGMSIAFVAMFHSELKAFLPSLIEPLSLVRMPLFFFLSGVFFSYAKPPNVFFNDKGQALLKPYFSVLLFVYLLVMIIEPNNEHWTLWGIFYGNGATLAWTPMWFLTHLFVVFSLGYCLFRYTPFAQFSLLAKWLILSLVFILGVLNIEVFWPYVERSLQVDMALPGLPFSLDIALITLCYFSAGAMLREQVVAFKPNTFWLCFSVAVFIAINLLFDARIDLNNRTFEMPVIATLGSIAGVYALLCVAYYLDNVQSIKYLLLKLGGASLFILIFHYWIGKEIYRVASVGISDHNLLFLIATTSFLLSILLPVAIKWLVQRSQFLSYFFFPIKSAK